MRRDHVGMSAATGAIRSRSAKDLSEEGRHEAWMPFVHVLEHRSENLILPNVSVKPVGQALQRRESSKPLIKGGDLPGLGIHRSLVVGAERIASGTSPHHRLFGGSSAPGPT